MYRPSQKYSYINHPQNLPLELNGSSKKKITPLNRQEYKEAQGKMQQQSKSIILKKLSKGKKDCELVKSVLPGGERRKQPRQSSIRISKEDKENSNGAGINYLMQKTVNAKSTTHKQRAHLHESYVEPSRVQGKRHFANEKAKTFEDQEKRPVHRKQTQNTKLSRDIYSNVYRIDREPYGAKKQEPKNLFKKGEELGFEDRRVKKFSDLKMIEMVGSQHIQKNNKVLREKRQDWRISNVNFF